VREGRSSNRLVLSRPRHGPLRSGKVQALAPSTRLLVALALFTLAIGVGTVEYLLISELGPLDAFCQTMITLSTVGYGEVEPFGRAEKIFTAFLIVFGVGTALYALSAIVQETLEGDLRGQLYRGRERMRIGQLNGHTIICGFGRVGQEIARELSERGIDIVLIEAQQSQSERARKLGYLVVEGDATQEDTLIRAQLGTAPTLLAALDSDPGNTFTTLTAKSINASCHVVARVALPENVAKMQLAGADRTVSPSRIGARRMVLSALQPAAADFMDTIGTGRHGDRVLAEFEVTGGSGFAGQSCGDFLAGTGATLLGLRRSDEVIVDPQADRRLEPGDILMLLAEEHEIAALGRPS